MAQFRITNSKGLFYQARPLALASLQVVAHIRQAVIPAIANDEARARAQQALDALEALPVVHAHVELCAHDDQVGSRHDRRACRGWIAPGLAQSESKDPVEASGPEQAGWLAIGHAYKLRGEIESLLAKAKAPKLWPFHWQGASTIKNKIKEAVFVEFDKAEDNAESEAFALHVYGRGFMDAHGSAGPLARARMFESAQAAARTAKSRRISPWKVVSVSVALGACVDLQGDSACDALSASIALQEAKALDQALEKAGVERLRAKLAELEAQEEPKPKAASARL